MILTELCNYYDLMNESGESPLPPRYWCLKKVAWELTLSRDGELVSCMPLLAEDGKNPQTLVVPDIQRTSGVQPFFLCDSSDYVFGADSKKGKDKREKFESLHKTLLGGLNDDGAQAFCRFLERYRDVSQLEDSMRTIIEESRENMVFRLEGDFGHRLHERPAIKTRWNQYEESAESDAPKSACLITGEIASQARLFPQVTGLSGAQSAGASLVSFNKAAFCSYGQDSADGVGSISQEGADKAGKALSYLLKSDEHHCRIGSDYIVFWADGTGKAITDIISFLINPEWAQADNACLARREDNNTRAAVQDALMDIRRGKHFLGVDTRVRYFILGIAPYQARLSVRFFQTGTLGELATNVQQFLKDTEMVNVEACSLSAYLEQVAPLGKDKKAPKDIPSTLITSSARAMLSGGAIPTALYEQLLVRMRADRASHNTWDLGRRAAMMRAYLLRKPSHNTSNDNIEGGIPVSLNENNSNIGYLLGRLFALLEKVQRDAIGNANSTIRDRYMAAAATTPARVFPQLMKLATYHISKSEYGDRIDRLIQAVMSEISDSGFPAVLSFDDQGMFYIGYYQQKEALYQKKAESEKVQPAGSDNKE